MISVCKRFRFEAAHKLPNHEGFCQHTHGHSYKLEVEVCGPVCKSSTLSEWGMIVDFGRVSGVVNEKVISMLDHRYLNRFVPNPTAENLVLWVVDQIIGPVEGLGADIYLSRVRLWETENSYAEWKR